MLMNQHNLVSKKERLITNANCVIELAGVLKDCITVTTMTEDLLMDLLRFLLYLLFAEIKIIELPVDVKQQDF